MNSIAWNHEVHSCLLRNQEKHEDYHEKQIKCMLEGNLTAKVYWKWGFLLPRKSLKIGFVKARIV